MRMRPRGAETPIPPVPADGLRFCLMPRGEKQRPALINGRLIQTEEYEGLHLEPDSVSKVAALPLGGPEDRMRAVAVGRLHSGRPTAQA